MAPRIQAYEETIRSIDDQLGAARLTSEQQARADARRAPAEEDHPGLDSLEHERRLLANAVADEERYPPDIRSEVIIAQHDDQALTVDDVSALLEGRAADLRAVEAEVERARERYNQHIRQTIHLLARRFREVCDQAGMDGDLELVPSEIEGEFGLEVKVAHEPGGAKRSYRSPAHSGGQRAKISILLLLAAMGIEGSADLLIMDEHTAHLDSRNIDYVAEVMAALRERVQFVLATPTNAEAYRLGWCDHQLVFFERGRDELYAPPIRLLTRMPEPDRRYASMGQLPLDV